MSARKRVGAWLCALGLLGAAACASVGNVPTTTPRKFTRVSVSVDGWDVAQAEAVLIDQEGRRTGWTRSGDLREINGCDFQSGWGDGIPNPRPDESDSAAVAEWEEIQRQDSIYAATNPLPTWHFFQIGNDMNYRAGGPIGLIDQGDCELRVGPIFAGVLHLSLKADGIGFRSRRDTTSAAIEPGTPQRWRLSWKQAGDSCVVEMTRLGGPGSAAQPRK